MAIKFKPLSNEVKVVGQEAHQAQLLSLMRCILNEVNKVQKQLEKITDQEIDHDDGRLV